MKYLDNQDDITKIEIVLTDFGMAGSEARGGTPIFSSPECLASPERKNKPDIFSLGRVFFFLLLPKETFLEFLFVPILSTKALTDIQFEIDDERILSLIFKMTKLKDRLTTQEIKTELKKIKVFKPLAAIKNISSIVGNFASHETKNYIQNLKKIS